MGEPIDDVTLGGLLDRLAAEVPERPALIYPDGAMRRPDGAMRRPDGAMRRPDGGLRWTFAELSERADELARGLIALGIEPGDHVAVWSDNRPEWVPLAYALARIGAVLVTVNVALVKDEVGYVLRQSRARAVIAARGFKADEYEQALEALQAEGACPGLEHVVAMDGDGTHTLRALVERGRNVDIAAVRARTAAVGVHDPANIQYTSGTTGFPKGVVLTHANVIKNGAAVGTRLQTTADDRVLLQVPLFHCFGCVIALLGAHTFGAALVALPRFDPLKALEAIATERCTIIHGVPTMYLALLEHEERSRFDTSSLRAGAMGGAMCPPELMRRVAHELGCQGIANAFGLTECSPAVAICGPDVPLEERISRAGPPLDGVRVRIVDPVALADRPTGAVGEVWVHGPNVMQGYFEKPEETAAALTADGWLRTGDLGTVDERGNLKITGRLKELIIRGGENVMPAEVEDALRAHPAVRDAAVFGIPSERFGEEVAAAVILRPGGTRPGAEELGAFLETRLARYKRPAVLHFVDAFPMTPSGKVKKFELRERVWGPTDGMGNGT